LGANNRDKVFKDKYKVAGRAKVSIMTRDGRFDFPIDLEFDVDELPF
jgi:hypothetical protein